MTIWDERQFRKPLTRKVPLKSTRTLKRVPFKPKEPSKRSGRSNEIPPASRKVVKRRSKGRCEIFHDGCAGEATSMHHRKLRRFKDHRPCNLIHVCWVMHQYIHHHTEVSYRNGWLVRQDEDPEMVRWRTREQ